MSPVEYVASKGRKFTYFFNFMVIVFQQFLIEYQIFEITVTNRFCIGGKIPYMLFYLTEQQRGFMRKPRHFKVPNPGTSPSSVRSDSAAVNGSNICRVQLEQHTVLIHLPHTEIEVFQPDFEP